VIEDLPRARVDGYQPFGSLRRFTTYDGYEYAVADPAALRGDVLSRAGSVETPRAYFGVGFWVAVSFIGGGLLLEHKAGVPLPLYYWIFAAPAIATCLGMSIQTRARGVKANRRVQGRVWRVRHDELREFDMCVLVDRITGTGAWQYRHVDPERLIPGLLWRYVDTVVMLGPLQRDIEQASAHPNLASLVHEKRKHVAEVMAALDETRAEIVEILRFAEGMDQMQRDAQRRIDMQAEEDMLRQRLGGSSAPLMRQRDDAWSAQNIAQRAKAYSESLAVLDRRIAAVMNQQF
jgi:hypothetical protein